MNILICMRLNACNKIRLLRLHSTNQSFVRANVFVYTLAGMFSELLDEKLLKWLNHRYIV